MQSLINGAIFTQHTNNMVIARDIELYSLCEHHLLPFYGRCHIGYIGKDKVFGLSKLARLVDMYARRLQLQERLTEQIAHAIQDGIGAEGVGVIIEGPPPLHDDARGGETELHDDHVVGAGNLPRLGDNADRVSYSHRAPAGGLAMRALLVANPKAGRVRGALGVARIVQMLSRAGLEVELLEPTNGREVEPALRRALEGADPEQTRVVVAGGDGTLRAVLPAVMNTPFSLALLPVGSVNVLARELGDSLLTH